jgi:hypothetical protein
MINSPNKLGIEGIYHKILKATDENTTSISYRMGEQMFPLRSGVRKGSPLSPLLVNISQSK